MKKKKFIKDLIIVLTGAFLAILMIMIGLSLSSCHQKEELGLEPPPDTIQECRAKCEEQDLEMTSFYVAYESREYTPTYRCKCSIRGCEF